MNKISTNFLVLLLGISIALPTQLKSMEQVPKKLSKIIYAKDLISKDSNKLEPRTELFANIGVTLFYLLITISMAYISIDQEDIISMLVSGCFACGTITESRITIQSFHQLNFKREFGALDEIVEKLADEKLNLENKNYDRECLICLEDGTESPLYINCRCSHYYHEHCLKTWLNQASLYNNEDSFKCIKCKKLLNKLVLSNSNKLKDD